MAANTAGRPAPSRGAVARARRARSCASTAATQAPSAACAASRIGRGASTAASSASTSAGGNTAERRMLRRVVAARLGAVEAVAPVLLGELLQRVARHVQRAQLGHADDPAAALEEPRRQLGVLVDGPAVVPAAVLVERRALPDSREDAGVDVLLLLGLPLGSSRRRRARTSARSRRAATTGRCRAGSGAR